MNYIYHKNTPIYYLKESHKSLFYNCKNGYLAVAESIAHIPDEFFVEANDTKIDFNSVEYEQLYLAVTESCNFRCKYCRQDKDTKILNMTIDEIENAIDSFFQKSKSPKSIVFFGGEPLLNFKGIKHAIKYTKKYSKDIKFSTVINGSLCTKEIASFFAENKVEVIVSIDGPKHIHNQARVLENGQGTYELVIKGYENLKEANCVTGLTCVVGPHNEDCFDELVELALKLKPNSFGLCLPHGNIENYAMNLKSFDDVHKKILSSFEILHKQGIYLVQVEQKMRSFILGLPIPFDCKACGKRIVTCRNKKFGICEGPITKPEMFVSDLSKLNDMVKLYKKSSPFCNSECTNCIGYRVCGGSCVYDKLTRHNRVDVKDEYRCGLTRMIAENGMRYIFSNLPDSDETYILDTEARKHLFNKFMTSEKI